MLITAGERRCHSEDGGDVNSEYMKTVTGEDLLHCTHNTNINEKRHFSCQLQALFCKDNVLNQMVNNTYVVLTSIWVNVRNIINNILKKDVLSHMLKDRWAKSAHWRYMELLKRGFWEMTKECFLCVTIVKSTIFPPK